MNVGELRYCITQLLLRTPSTRVQTADLVSPVSGDPQIHTVVTARDPFTAGNPLRRFRITFEEID